MSAVSAGLRMPPGKRINRPYQLDNVHRAYSGSQLYWSFSSPALLTYLGIDHPINAKVPAICDDGGTSLDIQNHYYVVYTRASTPGVLRACRADTWVATYTAQDCIPISWLTDQYDLVMPVGLEAGGYPSVSSIRSWVGAYPGNTNGYGVRCCNEYSSHLPFTQGGEPVIQIGALPYMAFVQSVNAKDQNNIQAVKLAYVGDSNRVGPIAATDPPSAYGIFGTNSTAGDPVWTPAVASPNTGYTPIPGTQLIWSPAPYLYATSTLLFPTRHRNYSFTVFKHWFSLPSIPTRVDYQIAYTSATSQVTNPFWINGSQPTTTVTTSPIVVPLNHFPSGEDPSSDPNWWGLTTNPPIVAGTIAAGSFTAGNNLLLIDIEDTNISSGTALATKGGISYLINFTF